MNALRAILATAAIVLMGTALAVADDAANAGQADRERMETKLADSRQELSDLQQVVADVDTFCYHPKLWGKVRTDIVRRESRQQVENRLRGLYLRLYGVGISDDVLKEAMRRVTADSNKVKAGLQKRIRELGAEIRRLEAALKALAPPAPRPAGPALAPAGPAAARAALPPGAPGNLEGMWRSRDGALVRFSRALGEDRYFGWFEKASASGSSGQAGEMRFQNIRRMDENEYFGTIYCGKDVSGKELWDPHGHITVRGNRMDIVVTRSGRIIRLTGWQRVPEPTISEMRRWSGGYEGDALNEKINAADRDGVDLEVNPTFASVAVNTTTRQADISNFHVKVKANRRRPAVYRSWDQLELTRTFTQHTPGRALIFDGKVTSITDGVCTVKEQKVQVLKGKRAVETRTYQTRWWARVEQGVLKVYVNTFNYNGEIPLELR